MGHGPDRLRSRQPRGSRGFDRAPWIPQSSAQAHLAGEDHLVSGRASSGPGGCGARRSQPSGGLALATPLCRTGGGRASTRQDSQARPGAARHDGCGQGSGSDVFGTAPGTVTHWTGRAVTARNGISPLALQRIWDAHRLRTFKRSSDPAFATKVEDIVGLYMDTPCHAVVL